MDLYFSWWMFLSAMDVGRKVPVIAVQHHSKARWQKNTRTWCKWQHCLQPRFYLSKDYIIKNLAFDGYVFATQGLLNSLASSHWVMLSNAGLNVRALANWGAVLKKKILDCNVDSIIIAMQLLWSTEISQQHHIMWKPAAPNCETPIMYKALLIFC